MQDKVKVVHDCPRCRAESIITVEFPQPARHMNGPMEDAIPPSEGFIDPEYCELCDYQFDWDVLFELARDKNEAAREFADEVKQEEARS